MNFAFLVFLLLIFCPKHGKAIGRFCVISNPDDLTVMEKVLLNKMYFKEPKVKAVIIQSDIYDKKHFIGED